MAKKGSTKKLRTNEARYVSILSIFQCQYGLSRILYFQLKSTEFLNLDAILEGVMHKLVVKPLKNYLHKLFVDHYQKTGAIQLLADNIQYASTRPTSELAIKVVFIIPDSDFV